MTESFRSRKISENGAESGEFFEEPFIRNPTTAAMRIACFGTKPYDRESFEKFNAEGKFGHQITYFEARLTEQTVRY